MTLADYRKKRGEPLTTEEHAEEHGKHPSALEYIQIGAILSIITAVEVALYYIDMSHNLLVAILVVLSISKFALVVAWFMHLRFDPSLFTILFATGLFGAMILFIIVMAIEHGSFV
jgi:cytochrome c oxidase subunit 4